MQDAREFAQHPDLDVYLRVDDEETLQGLVVHQEVRDQGASAVIDFQLGQAPRLPIGAVVVLMFHGESLARPTEVFGTVVYRCENPLIQRYEFRFDREAREVLASVSDRRRAARVHPDPALPVRVRLEADVLEAPIEAVARDLSARGLSLLLTHEDEAKLFAISQLRITLRLPDEVEPLQFHGVVRYRSLTNRGIQYGVEFDREGSEDFEGQQERVAIYVLGRLDEEAA